MTDAPSGSLKRRASFASCDKELIMSRAGFEPRHASRGVIPRPALRRLSQSCERMRAVAFARNSL